MADKRIDQLDAAGALAGTEPVPVYQDGAAKQSTVGAIAGLVDLSGKQDAFTLGTGLSFVSTVLTLSTNLQGWHAIAPSAKQDTLTPGTGIDITAGVISATGGGGLTHFTEAVNTSAPNATVPVCSLTAANAATNADWSGVPKGTGAFLASIPSGTSAGGNKRGSQAVDLQMVRSNATHVASGLYSVVCGGDSNQASSTRATVGGGNLNTASNTGCVVSGGLRNVASGPAASVAGGQDNTANAQNAVVAGGTTNTASGTQSTVGGGNANTASGSISVVAGGQSNTASGINSFIPGGIQATTRGITGAHAWASGQRSALGDRQHFGMPVFAVTTDTTPTILASAASLTAASVNTLPNNSAWAGTVLVVARSTGGDTAMWHFSVLAKRGANAAATSVPFFGVIHSHIEAGLTGVNCTIVANTTRGSVEVEFTGLAATTIDVFGEFFGGQVNR
jgi:hypothetical protein